MQVLNIIIYNNKGKHREVKFKLNSLNIITGKSRTGKSAIISILDYCMGRSSFDIFDGVNRTVVSWYSVTYQLDGKQIFVAKTPPKPGKNSNSEVCLFIGNSIGIPQYSDLHVNSNDDAVRDELERELGLQNNVTFRTESSGDAYKANLKHAKSFIFQEQGEIANKKILFHRQDESFLAQSIKDTLPYFLGAMSSDRLNLLHTLKIKKKELRNKESQLSQLSDIITKSNNKALQLVNEAVNVGLVEGGNVSSKLTFQQCNNLLSGCSQWEPLSPVMNSNDDLYVLQNRLLEEKDKQTCFKEKINKTRIFEKHHSSHLDNVIEHKARLKTIELFDSSKELECFVCGSTSKDHDNVFSELHESLSIVQNEIGLITQSSPKLKKYLSDLTSKENDVQILIDDLQSAIKAILKQRKESKLLRDKNAYISKIQGRISLFLESVQESKPDSQLVNDIAQLKHEVLLLQQELDDETVKDKLASALNVINSNMAKYAKKLKLEYADSPYRLDISRLTVYADNFHGAIPMHRQGSGENWLGCHVITYLSLHKLFSLQRSPVPSIFVLDQPSQVHFPDLQKYKNLEGNIINDMDIEEVTNLFRVFYNYCQYDNNNFQIIVTEHANLEESWFQESLVEEPWRNGRALIPYSWIDD